MLRFLTKLSAIFLIFSGISQAQCLSNLSQMPSLPKSNGPQVLIFVSFSMPEQSLKAWSEQAARVDGKLLLRGFVGNSLEKTIARTQELFGKKEDGEFLMDPEAFDTYNIKAVPAVVVTQETNCTNDTCPAPNFDAAYGDTGLEEALELIKSRGTAQGKALASQYLGRYRVNHD